MAKTLATKESITGEKTCFIIMPIKTPPSTLDFYKNDKDHFKHVMEHLFIPAIIDAGYKPIIPIAKGSDVIHSEIIKNLEEADFVLVDMSILNANVFFELGIRTALNKPTSLVVDNNSNFKVPFDTSIINYHTYDSSIELWNIEEEKNKITQHIKDCVKKTPNFNGLWNVFGLTELGKRVELSGDKKNVNEAVLLELRSMRSDIARINDKQSNTENEWRNSIIKSRTEAALNAKYSAQRSIPYDDNLDIPNIIQRFITDGQFDYMIDKKNNVLIIGLYKSISSQATINITDALFHSGISYKVEFVTKTKQAIILEE